MNKKNVVMVLLSIILAGCLGYAGAYFLYNPKYLELEKEYNTLSYQYEISQGKILGLYNQYDELENSFEDLNRDYTTLSVQYNALNNAHSTLTLQYDDLENKNIILKINYDELDNSYNTLTSRYDELDILYDDIKLEKDELYAQYCLESEFRIGNSLESYYDTLREGLGPTGARYWWFSPEESQWQTEVEFAVALAQHDLWRIYWPTYESEYERLTGENSYETAWHKLSAIADYIPISQTDQSTEKIKKILEFLGEHIHYESEINDVFLSPVETLGYKSGDCDDYSILTAALFEFFGIESAIGFFKNEENVYHAMVLVNLEDLGSYGNWYYSDLTSKGLSEGKWIKIEPQSSIEAQQDEWMHQWTLLVAYELEN